MGINELERMQTEQANVKALASRITSKIDYFEEESSGNIMGDIKGPDKMETCIAKFTANSSKAYMALKELSASFEDQITSTAEVVEDASLPAVPGAEAEAKAATASEDDAH